MRTTTTLQQVRAKKKPQHTQILFLEESFYPTKCCYSNCCCRLQVGLYWIAAIDFCLGLSQYVLSLPTLYDVHNNKVPMLHFAIEFVIGVVHMAIGIVLFMGAAQLKQSFLMMAAGGSLFVTSASIFYVILETFDPEEKVTDQVAYSISLALDVSNVLITGLFFLHIYGFAWRLQSKPNTLTAGFNSLC